MDIENNLDTKTVRIQLNCWSYLWIAQLNVESFSCVFVAGNVLFSLSHTHRLMTWHKEIWFDFFNCCWALWGWWHGRGKCPKIWNHKVIKNFWKYIAFKISAPLLSVWAFFLPLLLPLFFTSKVYRNMHHVCLVQKFGDPLWIMCHDTKVKMKPHLLWDQYACVTAKFTTIMSDS